jgi:DNA-binding transcriptional ArsR family regulator
MPVVPTDLLDARRAAPQPPLSGIEAAHLFALLSDPTRLRLLSRLHDDGELSVGELARWTGVSVANVSSI